MLAVIGFIVFVAILALVLDGGNAYAAKRQAQNAADAGALAGATAMCKYDDATLGRDTAIEYATKNGAVNPPVVVASLAAGYGNRNRHSHERHLFCGYNRFSASFTSGSGRSSMPSSRGMGCCR